MKPSTFVRNARKAGWTVITKDSGKRIHLFRDIGNMFANNGWSSGFREDIHLSLEPKGWRVTRSTSERMIQDEYSDPFGYAVDHAFRPYADMPEYCVAELPSNGDTCNRPAEDHAQ